MDKILCDPSKYPECCWTHKRESIMYKYYCHKCKKYHIRKSNKSKIPNKTKAKANGKSYKLKSKNVTPNIINNTIINVNISDIHLDVSEFIEVDSSNSIVDNVIENKIYEIDNINNKSASKSNSIIPDIDEVSDDKIKNDDNINMEIEIEESGTKLFNVKNHIDTPENLLSRRVLRRRIVHNKYTIDDYKILDSIGSGGFATVYLCESPDKEIYAVKKINGLKSFRKYRGIPCLMEASILATYKHDNLANTICTGAKQDGLYMVMELAKCDLSSWRRKHNPTEKLLCNISNQIVQALLFIRSENLIHGDVKCSNVLVYNDDPDAFNVKLSDFNLSSYEIWKSDLKVCTSTHKPIEVLRGDQWNEKIDIWSLGCTLYELKYKSSFMPYQGEKTRLEYINAIFDWQRILNRKSKPKYYNISYKKLTISDRRLNDKSIYNKLMFKMLSVEPENRPSIEVIAKNKYYREFKSEPGKRYKQLDNTDIYKEDTLSKLRSNLIKYSSDNDILDLATKIYSRYTSLAHIDTNNIRLVCVWIARKMIRKKTHDINIPLEDKKSALAGELFELERSICNKLSFRLHLH